MIPLHIPRPIKNKIQAIIKIIFANLGFLSDKYSASTNNNIGERKVNIPKKIAIP